MKPSLFGWLLVAFIGGYLVQWLIPPHGALSQAYNTGRYQLQIKDGFMVRFDTVTGKTWREVDIDPEHNWYLIEEANKTK